MSLIASFVVAFSAMPAQTESNRSAVEIFEQICLLGEGRFAPGTITAIDYKTLPRPIRVELETSSNPHWPLRSASLEKKGTKSPTRVHGEYFRIGDGRDATFLAIEERGEEGDPVRGRYCSLAAKSVDLQTAISILDRDSEVDPEPRRKGRSTTSNVGWTSYSAEGYRLRADKLASGYVFLQSVLTGEDEATRAFERLRPTLDKASKAKLNEMLKSQKKAE